jgi:hypothetical protein
MALDMKTRKSIYRRIFKRYQKAGKKGEAKFLRSIRLPLAATKTV